MNCYFLRKGSALSSGEFEITVGFYDGIPTNMNNKSTWLGLKLNLVLST